MAEERGSKQASQEESGEERQQRSPGTRKKSSGTKSRQRSSGRTTSKKPSSGRRQSGSGDGREQEEQESTQEREQSSADQGGQESADQGDQESAASGDGEGTAEAPRELSGVQLVKRGKELLAELTGHRPESVSGLDRHDGGWQLTVEVLELSRIPPSTDVLGTYQLDMTESGELTGYRRTDRYYRNQAQQRSE